MRGFVMAGCQHREIGGDLPVAVDGDDHARRRETDPTRHAINDLQRAWLAGRADERGDQLCDVAAIDAALSKGERPGRLALNFAVVLGEPPAEMQGIIGERAHIRGAYIEEMTRLRRAVGHAAADRAAFLDQRNAYAVLAVAQEMTGEQDAARAAPNHDHMFAVSRGQNLIFLIRV